MTGTAGAPGPTAEVPAGPRAAGRARTLPALAVAALCVVLLTVATQCAGSTSVTGLPVPDRSVLQGLDGSGGSGGVPDTLRPDTGGPTPPPTTTTGTTTAAPPPPGPEPKPAGVAPGSAPQPGQVGFRGDVASLRVVDGSGAPPAGTEWNSGALRIPGGDVTLDGVFVKGGVEYSGTGTLTIRNSVIEGNKNAYAPLIGNSGHVDVRDTTIRWRQGDTGPERWGSGGVHGDARFTVVRCDISGTPDGIQTGAHGTRIEQNWIHDLAMFGTYPDNSHNDGIQSYGGRDVVIANNRIDIRDSQGRAYDGTHQNGALFFMPDANWPLVNAQIVGNYLAGGGFTLRLGSPSTGVVVTDNSFGPTTGGWGELLIEGAQIATWSNNTDVHGKELRP